MGRAAKKEVLIPRLPNGGIPHWIWHDGWGSDGVFGGRLRCELEPAEDFHGVLKLVKVSSGRSAVTFWWQDDISGATYPMVQSEFNRLLQKGEWAGPLLYDGRWRPLKKGSNYQIRAVFPEDL